MKLGIIGAMEVEVEQLKEAMEVTSCIKRASMEFYEGVLKGLPVVVVRCGIGKVNAALCTQILIDEFDIDAVINTGIAGSLNNDINIGDFVISTKAVQHDYDIRPLGYKLGEIPGIASIGFKANEKLSNLVEKIAKDNIPEHAVFKGCVASGDQFIADKAKKEAIVDTFDALCCEMEGASIAQAASLNNVPFVVIRAISDKADESEVVDYLTFEKEAAYNCALLVSHVACELAQDSQE